MTGPVCVVGAGASGLCSARHLLERGFEVEVLERESDLGGTWNASLRSTRVYRSTQLISSKPGTEFPDHPMPDAFPDYPHHTEVLDYLRGYADRFGLRDRIRFDAEVARLEPESPDDPATGWRVRLATGEERAYGAVVIANGHNHEPRYPELPGTFAGRTLHSADYRTPDIFDGRRVLVMGGGNSGCDIVVEAAQHGAAAFLSLRRGYHIVPKYLFGWPADQVGDLLHRLRIPLPVRRLVARVVLRVLHGGRGRSGLPEPDHALFETHPVVNSLLPYYVRHGRVAIRPDVARLDGDGVVFRDGTREAVDMIVYATGYRTHLPFVDPALLNGPPGEPRLWLHVFHPTLDTLFVAGMIQADSGLFGIIHEQARAIAGYLALARAGDDVGRDAARALARVRRARRDATGPDLSAGIRYRPSARHHLEVEHWSYRRRVKKVADRLDRSRSGR